MEVWKFGSLEAVNLKEFYTNQYTLERSKSEGILNAIHETTGNEPLREFLKIAYYEQLKHVLDFGLKMYNSELFNENGNIQYLIPIDWNSKLYENFIQYKSYLDLLEYMKKD